MAMLDDNKKNNNIALLKEKFTDDKIDQLISTYDMELDKNIFLSHGQSLYNVIVDFQELEEFVERYVNEYSNKIITGVSFMVFLKKFKKEKEELIKRQHIDVYKASEEKENSECNNEDMSYLKKCVEDVLAETTDIQEGVKFLVTEQGDSEININGDLLNELNQTSKDTNQLLKKQLDTKTPKKATEEQVKQLEHKIVKSLDEIKKNTKRDIVSSLDNKTFIKIVIGSMLAFFSFMMIAILILKVL